MKPQRKAAKTYFVAVALSFSLVPAAFAQSLQIPHQEYPARSKATYVHSGIHDASTAQDKPALVHQVTITEPNSAWIRIHFGRYNLGKQSYVVLTSLEDGAEQRLDARSLREWRNSSAFFNGSSLNLSLHIGPSDGDVFFEIDKLTTGLKGIARSDSPVISPKVLAGCDGADDRVGPADPNIDPAIGRLVLGLLPSGQVGDCTAWIISNGAHLTAGHCVDEDNIPLMIEFDYPDSDPDGTVRFAHPNDQYAIDTNSLVYDDDLIGPKGTGSVPSTPGDDWAVFDVFRNSNTGLLPVEERDHFVRVSDDEPSVGTTVRITGNGSDDVPPGTTGEFNSDHKTLQTDTGTFHGDYSFYDDANWSTVDIAGGNSGSPFYQSGTIVSFGITTHRLNEPPDIGEVYCHAIAQDFSVQDVADVINDFPGSNTVYVDIGYPNVAGNAYLQSSEDGSAFEPYYDLSSGIAAANSGDIVGVTRGTYSGGITIDKAVTLIAPVGDAVIGGTSPKMGPVASGEVDEVDDGIVDGHRIVLGNYPNPFNRSTKIEFWLPIRSNATLVLYDVLGRRIATLVDAPLTAGRHSIGFTPTNLPAGVYLYRLTANEEMAVSAMTFLR